MQDVDPVTLSWIRDESDKLAVKNGCRFNMEQAEYARTWIESNCYLWEGVPPGTLITLKDWQYDFVMRLFGWMRPMLPTEPHYNKPEGRTWCRRFTRASVWLPKKNAKSPTLAAIGLYLLMADGEPGQKVYVTARDGKQALIPQQNAINMLEASPSLRRVLRVNKSTKRITHAESRSFMDIVSGDNKKSQEGFNGCVICDETHVVDAELMAILEGAGISRAEPLHVEVSTAGNDPSSYGKQQWDKGLRVAAGLEVDQAFLFISYHAPQDLSFDELDKDPVKYGKMANPAWGRLTNEVEFLAHYNRAKRSITDLLNFMMYRLNIWQRSANPWLKTGDVSKCREDFTDEDLERCRVGGSALDMNRVNDFACFGLLFQHPEHSDQIRARVWTFWPEQMARDHAHEGPFLDWAKSGHLILTPGNTTDINFIRAYIANLRKRYPFKEFAYDEWNADGISQELADGMRDHDGQTIAEGIGVERVPFPQTIKNFAGPTDLMEAMIIDGKLRHNGDPCLMWQMGHTEVYRDANGNKRPMKPDGKKDGIKKIDSVVTLIMALARYTVPPKARPSISFID